MINKFKGQKSKVKRLIQNFKFYILSCAFTFLIFNFAPHLFSSLLWGEEWGKGILFAQDDNKDQEAIFIAEKAFDDGFYDVSIDLLAHFLKDHPDSKMIPQAEVLIGKSLFHQNKFLDALEKFNQLMNNPKAAGIHDEVLYWIAEIHFKGNNFSKSGGYYQKIIDNYPKSLYLAASYYSAGWCLFQQKAFDKAIEYFQITEERFPKEPYSQEAMFKIIECLYNLKDYNTLKDKLKNYLKIYAKDTAKISYLHFYLAEAEYYLNNFSNAVDEYSKTLSAASDAKTKALCGLGAGWAYLKLKQYKEADKYFSDIQPDKLEKASRDVLLLGKAVLSQETQLFNEAKNLYNQILDVSSDPVTQIQAFVGKAEALYNMAEYNDAIAVYKEALTKISDQIPQEIIDKLHYGFAWGLLKEGKFKEAIDEFRKTAKLSTDKTVKVSALCQIGDAYLDSSDFDKALETYDNILKNYPDSFYSDYVQYQMGVTLLKLSNYEAAIIAFKTLKANFPDSKLLDDASYALGLSYFQRQDYHDSRETFEKFQSDYKNSPLKTQAMYLWGSSLYNLGKFNEAIEVFKNIVKLSTDSELSQKCEYEIADCFYRMGEEKEAMSRFKILRSKYPDSKLTPEVMWWLGEYYYRHRELELARRYFSSLIKDFPASSLIADAYYALGSSYAEESKYEEAVKNFKKVMELIKSDLAGTASIAIADIYFKQNELKSALEIYTDVLNSYKNLAHLIYPKIGEVYYKLDNYEQALDFYNKSLNLVPLKEMSTVQFRIAEIKEAQKKPQEAIDEYLKVSYLYSENNDLSVRALLRVAAIYEDKENYKEAVNMYNKIAALDVEEAKYAKEKIEWINTHNRRY